MGNADKSREDDSEFSFRRRAVESVGLFGLAVRMVWSIGPGLLIGLTALLIVQAVIPTAQLQFTRHAVDNLAAAAGIRRSDGAAHPLVWFGLLTGALVATVLISPLSSLLQALIGDRLGARLGRAVLQACNSWQGVSRFEDPTFADDLSVAREKTDSSLSVITYGSRAVVTVATTVGVAVTLGGLNPLVPVVLILANLPGLPLNWRYRRSVGSLMYVLTPRARRLEYLRDISVAAEPAKDIRLAGAHPFLHQRYDRDWTASEGEIVANRRTMIGRVLVGNLLAGVALAATFCYLVWATASGAVGLGGLVMFSSAAILLDANLSMLGFDLGFLPLPLSFLRPTSRVLAAGPDLRQAQHPVSAPSVITAGISFDDVHFGYPNGREILRGVTFDLHPGESLALVGGNGAGKTTLIKLLLRLYDPTAGRISLDGVDLRDYDPEDLRRRMGVIFQDFGRYELTAGENIGIGDVDRLHDQERILAAANRGGADDLLGSLPNGLQTVLGRELGDRELSGGQWQRIALSRAFMADSRLLVLDEPTAELDPRGEYEVFQRFAELTRDRMTILVSHRFSTVRMADRIVLLEHGVVTEDGDHRSLIAADGEYARMYRLQASQYLGDRDTSHDEQLLHDEVGR